MVGLIVLFIMIIEPFIFDNTLKDFLIRIYDYMISQKWHVTFVYKLKKKKNDGIRPKKLIIKEVDSLLDKEMIYIDLYFKYRPKKAV